MLFVSVPFFLVDKQRKRSVYRSRKKKGIIDMRAYERLLRYAKIYTESDPASESHPSSANQFDLARILEGQLKELGAGKTELTEQCLVYGWFEATRGREEDETVALDSPHGHSP